MRRSAISLAFAGLLFVGCGGSNPGVSIPPINIPTFSVPSISIPTFPPIDLPSGIVLPSIDIPSFDPTGGSCALVTADELTALFGGAPTTASDEQGQCLITPPNEFIPFIVRRGNDETLEIARTILQSPQDLTVAGNPAVFGSLFGELLYVEKGGQILVVQAAAQQGVQDKLVGIAEAALARFP